MSNQGSIGDMEAGQIGGRDNVKRWGCLPFSKTEVGMGIFSLGVLVGFGLCSNNMIYDPVSYNRVCFGYAACIFYVGLMIILYCRFPRSGLQFAAMCCSFVLLVLSGIYLSFAVKSVKNERFMTEILVAVFSFTGFTGLLCYSLPDHRRYFRSRLWNMFRRAAPPPPNNDDDDLQRVDSSDSLPGSGHQSANSQGSTNTVERDSLPGANQEAACASDLQTSGSRSYATASEGYGVIRPSSTDEVSSLKTSSEVAAKVSQISSESASGNMEVAEASQASESASGNVESTEASQSSESAPGKMETEEAIETPSSPGDGAEVPSQSSQENASESEGESSGELRQRKLLNPEDLPESSSSSEERKY